MEEKKEEKPTRKELIDMIRMMQENIEALPPGAMSLPITHYDFCSLLMLLSEIFKAED